MDRGTPPPLDARDELLFLLWRDGKLSYEDALRYSTSPHAVRYAVRAEEQRRRGSEGGAPVASTAPIRPKDPSPLSTGARKDDDETNR